MNQLLELYNLIISTPEKSLFFIPGWLFFFAYNKRKPDKQLSVSGWPYIFSIIIIAGIIWYPVGLLFKDQFIYHLIASCVIASIAGLACTKFTALFPQTTDGFYKKCVDIDKNDFLGQIFLTLKNGKSYIAFLLKYPENPEFKYELQTISIIPIISGYRNESTKEICWNVFYPEYETEKQFFDMEVIIPRSEIVTFGKFNEKIYEYFEKMEYQTGSGKETKG